MNQVRFESFSDAVFAFAITLLVLAFTVSHQAADLVLVALALAAGLESILGYCLGCRIFGLLMRVGVVPEAVCEECADVSRHVRATVS